MPEQESLITWSDSTILTNAVASGCLHKTSIASPNTEHKTKVASTPIREWLAIHPHLHHAFIPMGAAWLNLIEGWWWIFRRKAFARQSFSDHDDIAYVTRIATAQLNRHARP